MKTTMNRRSFLHTAGLTVLAAGGRAALPASRAEQPAAPKDLGDLLEAVRKEHQLPGLAAAALRGDRVVAEGVAGVRRVGREGKITLDDRFGIGSCTKRMTVLLIARLVDAGALSFDTTLAEALPDVKMRDDYRKVTVAQLLNFTGGIQPYTQIGPQLTPILFEKGEPAVRRARFVEHVLQEEPVVKPGSGSRYSNAGYVLAAFVAARRAGREYEALLAEHVFQPLHMTRSGLGRPPAKDRPHEVWLHVKGDKGYTPEPEEERPPEAILAPAGNVRCSVRDFAKFAAYELAAARGKDPLLKPTTAKRSQELVDSKRKDERSFFGGSPWLSAGFLIAVDQNIAAVAAVNGGSAQKAIAAVLEMIRKRHLGPDK